MGSRRVVACAFIAAMGCDGVRPEDRDPLVEAPAALDAAAPDARSESDAGPDCAGAEMRLGIGSRELTEVADGDTIYLFRSPGGPYLFWLAFRARGVDPGNNLFCYTERFPATGEIFGARCWRVGLIDTHVEGWFERWGIFGFPDDDWWNRPADIRGKDVRVDATLESANGCTVSDGFTAHVTREKPY